MIRSMTGFARQEARHPFGMLAWELRSVNHRYLETHFRLPEEFRPLEAELRECIAGHLKRGKVDVLLRYEPLETGACKLEVNLALARELASAVEAVEGVLPLSRPVTSMDLLRWQGVVTHERPDLDPLYDAARTGLKAALEDLVLARSREGGRIADMLTQRCGEISSLVTTVRARLPEVQSRLREKLLARLEEAGVTAEPGRLEQELVLLAQRMDVAEELDRLDSHVAEAEQILGRDEPVGRRLDFLMQEFNREANTLSSKSQDTETTQTAVELKVLIEQMREQVQNIE